MVRKEYVIGKTETGRTTITLHADQEDIPFNVWRDIGRLAGKSHSRGVNNETFEFLGSDPMKAQKAIEILRGALWKEKNENHI